MFCMEVSWRRLNQIDAVSGGTMEVVQACIDQSGIH